MADFCFSLLMLFEKKQIKPVDRQAFTKKVWFSLQDIGNIAKVFGSDQVCHYTKTDENC